MELKRRRWRRTWLRGVQPNELEKDITVVESTQAANVETKSGVASFKFQAEQPAYWRVSTPSQA
jgi:hypothetical protein